MISVALRIIWKAATMTVSRTAAANSRIPELLMNRCISILSPGDRILKLHVITAVRTRRDDPGLIDHVNRVVVLHAQNHRLKNVHFPAVRNPQPQNITRFRYQPAAQRHPQIPRNYPQNHRLAHPGCVSTFHVVPRPPSGVLEQLQSARWPWPGQWYRGLKPVGGKYQGIRGGFQAAMMRFSDIFSCPAFDLNSLT